MPGALTHLQSLTGDAAMATARGVAVSKDGRHVYVASNGSRVAIFSRAADGTLTPAGCIADAGVGGCAATAEGLGVAQFVAVSPDGEHVYVTGSGDGAIAVLDRDADTGALSALTCVSDIESAATCPTTAAALAGAEGIAISPDGESVYVAAQGDQSVTFLERNPTGSLSPESCFVHSAIAGCTTVPDGMSAPREVTVAPDGRGVYAAAANDGIVDFLRDPADGSITFVDTETSIKPSLAVGVAVSADNTRVYAGTVNDSAVHAFTRDPATGDLSRRGCIEDEGANGPGPDCTREAQGLGGAEGVAVAPDGAGVYVAGFGDSTANALIADASPAGLASLGCFRDEGLAPGGCSTADGLRQSRAVAVSADARNVYFTGQNDAGIAVFARELPPPGTDPGDGDDGGDDSTPQQPTPPAPPPPPTPPGPPPPPLPLQCTNPVTLLVGCGDATDAPGQCGFTANFPQCQRPGSPPVSCSGTPLICRPAGGSVGACGSFGIVLPECDVPRREVPGLCVPQGSGTPSAPVCGFEMDPVTICPPPGGTTIPACNFATTTRLPTVGDQSAITRPRAAVAQSRRARVSVTIGCPRAAAVRGRCRGRVVVDALRTVLLNALASEARGSAGVYEFFVPGGRAYAARFRAVTTAEATRVLGGTAVPAPVDVAAVLRALGRDDQLTRSWANALRRAVNEYRALAQSRRPPPGSTRAAAAQARRRTAAVKRFSLRAGIRRARVDVPLAATTVRALTSDARGRSRAPVRVLVVIDAEPRPVVRFVDAGLRVRR